MERRPDPETGCGMIIVALVATAIIVGLIIALGLYYWSVIRG